jgi:hypothetical protein
LGQNSVATQDWRERLPDWFSRSSYGSRLGKELCSLTCLCVYMKLDVHVQANWVFLPAISAWPAVVHRRFEPVEPAAMASNMQQMAEHFDSLTQQLELLRSLHPNSPLVQKTAQAAELMQSSAAGIAEDIQNQLQAAKQQAEMQQWRASSILADFTKLPVAVLQQLDDTQQQSLQWIVSFLQEHQLQGHFMPVLQHCATGTTLAYMTGLIERFMRHTAPQCYKGPARALWDEALQVLLELQQLIGHGSTDKYLQLCGMLLVADTPLLLRSQLQQVRVQLDELHIMNFNETLAAAATAAASVAEPFSPSATAWHAAISEEATAAATAAAAAAAGSEPGLFSEALLAELSGAVALPEPCMPGAGSLGPASCGFAAGSYEQPFSRSNSMPAEIYSTTPAAAEAAAAIVNSDAPASDNIVWKPWDMEGHHTAQGLFAASYTAGSSVCTPAYPDCASVPGGAAAADSTAAGRELGGADASYQFGHTRWAEDVFGTEYCYASSAALRSMPGPSSAAAAADGSSGQLAGCSVGGTHTPLPDDRFEMRDEEAIEADDLLPDDPFGMGCSAGFSNDDTFTGNTSDSDSGSDSHSGEDDSSTRKGGSCSNNDRPLAHKQALPVPADGPGTPAVVSVAASCAPSARASCAESGEGSSSSSTTAGSSSINAGLLVDGSTQQHHTANKGGVLRRVAGCGCCCGCWCGRCRCCCMCEG